MEEGEKGGGLWSENRIERDKERGSELEREKRRSSSQDQ